MTLEIDNLARSGYRLACRFDHASMQAYFQCFAFLALLSHLFISRYFRGLPLEDVEIIFICACISTSTYKGRTSRGFWKLALR